MKTLDYKWYYAPKYQQIQYTYHDDLYIGSNYQEISEIEAEILCGLRGKDLPDRSEWFIIFLDT